MPIHDIENLLHLHEDLCKGASSVSKGSRDALRAGLVDGPPQVVMSKQWVQNAQVFALEGAPSVCRPVHF